VDIDAQRWLRISALFDELVEKTDAARDEALARLRIDDAALADEVAALLRHVADGGDDEETLLAAPARVAVRWAEDADAKSGAIAGKRIGPWRVVRELGRGGMGVVYLAERADGQFEQRVALKLIRVDDDSTAVRRRFLRERQILARLDHPNIARLLDGGIAEDGRPYFAMEYVDGQPLLAYVAERACDAKARLSLFADICQAVQFAHRQLIVHRDIKPSNVLVTADGAVKLLDFGIATVLDMSPSDDTQTRAQPFTPAYAAPEQLRGGAVTTSADIYALGALLYELMSGRRPYRLDDRAPPVEWAHILDGPMCPPPSAAITASTDADTAKLPPLSARLVHGDLDWIAMTALRREPERRYATAEALAADVLSHLGGRPVVARGDSTRYVLGKFIRRHRVGAALAAAAALVLIVALAVALREARIAQEHAGLAQAAAEQAQRQTRRAEAVREFLVGVFEQADPDANKGQPITAHQLLEKGERQIGKGDLDPASEADAATLLASLYEQVGDFDRAQALLKRVLPAAEDPTTPRDIRARVLIGIAGIEDDNDAYDIAIRHAEQGLSLLDNSTPVAAELTAKAHNILAHCLIGKGDWTAAETLLRAALSEDVAALGDRNEAVAEEWLELGSVLGNARNFVESQAAFERAIAAWREGYGENSYRVAHALNELSNMLGDKGDLAGAERALRQSLQIRMQTVGPAHRDTLIVEHNLLVVLETEGRLAEALSQRLLLIERVKASAQMHPRDLGFYYAAAGKDLRDLGRFDEAEAIFRKAVEIYDESLGKNSAQSVSSLRGLGTTQTLAGQYRDAETTLGNALAILQQHEAPDSLNIAGTRTDLGNLLRLEHRSVEALSQLRQASAAFERVDSTDRYRALASTALSEAELDGGDADGALATAEASLSKARDILPERHYLLGTPLFALARAELALHRDADAEILLREALAVRSPPYPANDPRVLELKVALLLALDAQHRNREANALRAEVEPSLRASHLPYAIDLRQRLNDAAAARLARRDTASADLRHPHAATLGRSRSRGGR